VGLEISRFGLGDRRLIHKPAQPVFGVHLMIVLRTDRLGT